MQRCCGIFQIFHRAECVQVTELNESELKFLKLFFVTCNVKRCFEQEMSYWFANECDKKYFNDCIESQSADRVHVTSKKNVFLRYTY